MRRGTAIHRRLDDVFIKPAGKNKSKKKQTLSILSTSFVSTVMRHANRTLPPSFYKALFCQVATERPLQNTVYIYSVYCLCGVSFFMIIVTQNLEFLDLFSYLSYFSCSATVYVQMFHSPLHIIICNLAF